MILLLLPGNAFGIDLSEDGNDLDNEGLYSVKDSIENIDVVVSADNDSAYIDGATFAVSDFSRAQKGSFREIEGMNVGYTYYQGSSTDYTVAISTDEYVLVYIPSSYHSIFGANDRTSDLELKAYICALDARSLNGGIFIDQDVPWYFTSNTEVTVKNVKYSFDVEIGEKKYYVSLNPADLDGPSEDQIGQSDIPTHVSFMKLAAPDDVEIVMPATGFAALREFLAGIDYSPLFVTLKTTGCAIILIFILGLAAAYFTLRLPKKAQDIFDTIFTIPMVIPPTVCGFLLLLLLGRNTSLGQWFIDIGFPLIFSWPATVIAATVVAFPLMYRSCRGAFENLDQNMLDAARTLGWSNARIFFKLMIPLSWSSIAAATVLAFARALGEFGATLFLAGNYVGITRTIPIAIYFEWMSGNTDVAIFWTIIILIFSFLVILFINLWSRHTTKYRKRVGE